MGQKNTFFEKQTGEVAENKGLGLQNKAEQTGKQSGEAVENTYLWKKRTENEPENKAGQVVEKNSDARTNQKRTGAKPEAFV